MRVAGRSLLGTGLALAAVACGPHPEPVRAPPPHLHGTADVVPHARARPTRRATLTYEVGGRSFPLPVVRGTIAGHPATMIVDTGANTHVIAGWFARKFDIPLEQLGDVGIDHTGQAIPTFRVAKPEVVIDGWGPLAAGPALATELPALVEALGIAGFLSPQQLIEEGDAVLLDLPRGELRATWWDEAHVALAGAPMLGAEGARTCEENDGPIKGLSFVVPAVVEGQKVALLVDSGAHRSDLFAASPAGKALAGRSAASTAASFTAAGKVEARILRGARVAAGAFAVTADVDLIGGAADPGCPRDGVLAMDVLRSCALLLARGRMDARCATSSRATR